MKSFLKGTGKGPEASACEHESPASKGKLNNMIGCVKHNRKGFSLVEMLTAVAILAILVSISIVGVIGYMNNLKATEMDSAARQIFVAAQNHLTQAKASGQWDAFVSNPTGSTTTDSGITLDEARTIGELIPEMPSDFTSDAWDNSKERYRYIEFTEETALLQSSALKYLLPFGALEEDIRTDGHYVIEYDAVAGNVYGVFYTDSNLPLEYSKVIKKLNETKGDVSGRSNTREGSKIRARYLDVDGNKYTVGYYGGAMANYLEAEVLAEPTVEIKNEERLIVEVTDPNYFKNTNSGVGYQTKVVLNVKGVESGAEKMIPLDLGDYKPTISNIVTDRSLESLHTDDGFVFYAGPSIDSSNLSQTNLVYSVVFDDITNSLQDGDTFKHGQHFAELFPEFIPGEDIVVTAECSSNHVLSTPVKGSATGNSLFESRIDVGNEATVRVANVRNIENLDNSISGLPQKIGAMDAESMDKKIVKSVVTRVIQIKDIDFKVSENNELGFYDGKSICAYNSVDPNLKFGDVKAHAAQFVPISNEKIKEYSGNGYTLSNFKTNRSTENNNSFDGSAGLFSTFLNGQDITVSDLTLKDFEITGENDAGTLVGTIGDSATLKATKITVINPKVKTKADGKNAGGLVGTSGQSGNDSYTLCGVFLQAEENSDVTIKDIWSNHNIDATNGNAGGLIGKLRGGTVNRSFATVAVKAGTTDTASNLNGNAGGVIGMISGLASVSDTYAGGMVDDANKFGGTFVTAKTNGNAGGLIGYANEKINVENCYATCAVQGGIVGGLIAKSTDATSNYENCYFAGAVMGDTAEAQMGVFAVNLAGNNSNCFFLDDMNDGINNKINNISAKKFVELATVNDNTDTHIYNRHEEKTSGAAASLDPSKYPFNAVNRTCISRTATHEMWAHYGDWEIPVEKVVTNPQEIGIIGWAYREKKGSEEHWYIRSAKLKNGVVDDTLKYDDLPTTKGTLVGSDTTVEYGMLVDDSDGLGLNPNYSIFYETNTTRNEFSNGVRVTIDNKPYVFYKLNSSTQNSTTGISTTPTLRVGTGSHRVTYYFNTDFAAAINSNSSELGTATFPYQVRTNTQLRNINNENEYLGKVYHQTADIDLVQMSSSNYVINAGNGFGGSYDGIQNTENNSRYSITFSKASGDAGLFKQISDGATVQNLELDGNITQNGGAFLWWVNTLSAGSVCGTNRGNITNCVSKVTFDIEMTSVISAPTLNVGGIVAICEGGTVNRCVSESRINITIGRLISSITARVGGVIGQISNGTVSESYSKIIFDSNMDEWNAYLGGFVGGTTGGRIENCYSICNFGNVTTTQKGLFAGTTPTNTQTIFNCHAFEMSALYGNPVPRPKDRPFTGINSNNTATNCVAFSSKTGGGNGVQYVTDANIYKAWLTYYNKGWDENIWTITNGMYPTLKNNPEPATEFVGTLVTDGLSEEQKAVGQKLESFFSTGWQSTWVNDESGAVHTICYKVVDNEAIVAIDNVSDSTKVSSGNAKSEVLKQTGIATGNIHEWNKSPVKNDTLGGIIARGAGIEGYEIDAIYSDSDRNITSIELSDNKGTFTYTY